MNRATFMGELRAGLAGVHAKDVEEILADYESYFADGAAAGRSEQDIADGLGDPSRLARELRAEVGFKRWEAERSAGNFVGVILALLGLATIDLIFLIPALGVMLIVVLAVGAACLALMAIGSFLLFNRLGPGWHHPISNGVLQLLTGAGLLSGGLGGGALLLLITDWVARALIRYARLHFQLFNTAASSV